jgi:HSP20 family protein
MSLMRWDPFREVLSLREAVNRMFDDTLFRPSRFWSEDGAMMVPLDMIETDDSLVVTAPLPGVKPDDVNITITGNTLTIKGEFKQEQDHKKGNVHFQERRYGAFHRSITLPTDVNTNKIEATFEDGVLKLQIPKTEEAKPKQIEIKVKK